MGFGSIFKLGSAKDEKQHKILCLASWFLGGVAYCLNFYDTIGWTATYPNPNFMAGAVWSMNIALRLFSMWLPMSFLLLQWKSKSFSLILYFVGGGVALLFGLMSVALIVPYMIDPTLLEKNFNDLIKPSMKKGVYPVALKAAYAMDGCCMWHGPADLVEDGMMDEKIMNTNEEFVREVAVCAGRIFSVDKNSDGNLVYSAGATNGVTVPGGCKPIQEERANRIMILNLTVTVILCIVAPILMFGHYKLYKKLGIGGSVPVRPATSQQIQQAQNSTEDAGGDDDPDKKNPVDTPGTV